MEMNVFDRFECAFCWNRKNVLGGSYESKLNYCSTRREDDDFDCRGDDDGGGGGGTFVKLTVGYARGGDRKRKKLGRLDDSGNMDNNMLVKFGNSDNDYNEDDNDMDLIVPREKVRVIDTNRYSHLATASLGSTLYLWDAKAEQNSRME